MKSFLSGAKSVSLVFALIFLVSACTSVNKSPSARMSVLDYYQQGLNQLVEEDTAAAAKTLDDMAMNYPFHAETGDLYISLMDGYYRNNEPDKLIELVDQFLSIYPSHKDVAYANYLAGMANYSRGKSRLSPNNAAPDSTYAEMALKRFHSLLRCCSNTRYAFEANQKIANLESMIALYHLRYMEWDYDAGRLPQATQRGKSIVSTYPNTIAAKRAGDMLASVSGVNPVPEPIAITATPSIITYTAAATTATAPVALVSTNPVVKSAVVAEPVVETAPAAVPEKFYTLQLGSFSEFERVVKAVGTMGLEDLVVYYRYIVNGKTLYIATYGKYESKEAASPGVEEVLKITGDPNFKYWLRQLDSSKLVAVQ